MNIAQRILALVLVMTSLNLHAEDVEIFAAASLTDALKEVAAAYAKNSSDKILFNFAASNTLAMQIKAGAPADIFFSADEAKMSDLAKDGLIVDASRKDLLSNSLVIIVPADATSTSMLVSAGQLINPAFKKIALGQPESVPAGVYAKAYLQKIGLWDKLTGKIVPCESVRAALAAVETGNVDAGFVYKTDAIHSAKVMVAYEIPTTEGPAIAYPIALIQGSKNAVAAQKFIDYLSTPDAVKTFEKYGFIAKS